MESEGSLPHSQTPAICPYPKPDQSSPGLPIPLLTTRLKLGLKVLISIKFTECV